VYFEALARDVIMGLPAETKLLIDPSYAPSRAGLAEFSFGPRPEGLYYFRIVSANAKNPVMRFSPDPSRVCYAGFSVTYCMLQWAAYMGFKEIFLLGIDHSNYRTDMKDMVNGNDTTHFSKDYSVTGLLKYHDHIADINLLLAGSTKAYECAETYTRRHGIRIYNATRGGELEFFERVDFDTLFWAGNN
jgi:hypothetical protein